MTRASLLDAEESALAAIVRSSQDAVIAKTVAGVITSWNAGATSLYGYSAAEMVGTSIEGMFPVECLDDERARHERVARGHAESGYRCVRTRRDGRHVEVVMSMSPVRATSGEVVGLASISRLVSDDERADARYAALLEAAPDAMIGVDALGAITVVNANVGVLFGYDPQSLIGEPLDLLMPERLDERQSGKSEPRWSPWTGASMARTARRKDGSTFPAEVSLASATDQDGQPMVMAAIRDVTTQREHESRLRQLTENVETLFTLRQVHPSAYLFFSPSFETLTGYAAQQALDDPLFLFEHVIHPEDRELVIERLVDPTRAGRTGECEHRIIRNGGELRWVRSVATPVPNPGGQVERVVGTTEDITTRVLAREALARAELDARAANQAKNEFLSRMSHELRTPLNAVIGFGQLLERGLRGTEHLDSVQDILRAGRHLLALINDILDIAGIEAGKMSVSLEPVSVVSIVDEVVTLMQPLADAAHVTLVAADGDAGCFVLADRQRVRQIMLNLVGNSVKYNDPGGHVWLGWKAANDRTMITVRDDGPGISGDLQARLFTPFDRLGAEATAIEGTGVGLALTAGLAELMGGDISCVSEAGEGARFTVSLPSAEEPSVRRTESVPAESVAPTEEPARVLLYIEDNAANVRLMESVVRLRPSWKFLFAGLGQRGIELARAHRPDLVMLDLHLPDVSGCDVLVSLLGNSPTADIPVVVCSADANDSQQDRLLASGAVRYLTKPLDVDEVLAVLDGVADLSSPEHAR